MTHLTMRLLTALPLLILLLVAGGLPILDPGQAQAHHLCGNTGSPYGPFDLQTYEDRDYKATYARTMELAGWNQLLPDRPTFALPPLEGVQGYTYVPPVLLKAIAWIESGWAQASYDPPVQYGQVGPVLASHDCGYGIMQVTSGMQNVSGIPNSDQAMIGGHYGFNIARGARILAEKWNGAPEFRPVVGSRNTQIIEDWYYALWSYNGFAFKNHPLNPQYNPQRQPYRCDGSQSRSDYPYQELVFGCVANPPWRGGVQLWNPRPANLPDLADPAFAGPLRLENWSPCSQSLQCAPMNIPTPNPWHSDPATPPAPREQVIGLPRIALSTVSMSFVAPTGRQSASQTLLIGNAGNGVLPFKLTTSAPWIRVSRLQGVALGVDLGHLDHAVSVSADASSLHPGTHTGRITIESLWAVGAGSTIEVTLQTSGDELMRTPDGAIYLLKAGLKRHVPDPATFEGSGYSWSWVVPVPSDSAAGIPTGHPIPSVLAHGRLLRPPGANVPVYVMDSGKRRHVTGADIFARCGFGWDAIDTVSGPVLDGIPMGPPLTAAPCPWPSFPNGTLLQSSDGRVWVTQSNARRWIIGANAFSNCGYYWGNVDALGDGLNAQLAVAPDLHSCTAEGSLLWTEDGRTHLIRGGQLRPIPDPLTFELAGFDWSRVAPVGAFGFGVGEPLGSLMRTGILVRAPGDLAPVYVLDEGKKRHITSAGVFNGCAYDWSAISVVSSSALSGVPTGPSLQGAPCPLISFPFGTLLQQQNGAVWITVGPVRKWVNSMNFFGDCGYLAARIVPAIDPVLRSFGTSTPTAGCSSDGSLVTNVDGSVYLVRGGWKRHIPNPATLEGFGLSWSAVTPAPDGWLPTGKPILDLVATGRLVRPTGAQVPVYVMEAGKKRHILSASAFAACGYGWDAIAVLPAGTIAGFADGPALSGSPCPQPTFADGTLLLGSEGKIWVVHGGQRRWITGPDAFSACGYRWVDVDRMPDSIIAALPQGANLSASPCP